MAGPTRRKVTYLGLCPRCGDPIITDVPADAEPLTVLLICDSCAREAGTHPPLHFKWNGPGPPPGLRER